MDERSLRVDGECSQHDIFHGKVMFYDFDDAEHGKRAVHHARQVHVVKEDSFPAGIAYFSVED